MDQVYRFQYSQPKKRDRLKIYEAHVGISSAEEGIATYENFRVNILPRIVRQGLSDVREKNLLSLHMMDCYRL